MNTKVKMLILAFKSSWANKKVFASQMIELVECLRDIDNGQGDPSLQADLAETALAAAEMAEGDFKMNFTSFKRLTAATAEDAGRDRLFLTVYQTADGPQPLVMLISTDRRTIEAQEQVLRRKEFVDLIAARIGAQGYSDKVLKSRIQGVIVNEVAGAIKPYAHFSDFLAGDFERNSATDGGLLYSWFADDLITDEWDLVRAAFPSVAHRVEQAGLANIDSIRFLTFVHTIAHDTLGHCDMERPELKAANRFEREGIEELNADVQAMWTTINPHTRSLLKEIMTEEEMYAMGRLWFVKRIIHYIRRGANRDPIYGHLNSDNDARTGVNFFEYAIRYGAIEYRGSHFDLHEDIWEEMIESLLDRMNAVFGELDGGAKRFEKACRQFNLEFGTRSPRNDKWVIPSELREFFTQYLGRKAA